MSKLKLENKKKTEKRLRQRRRQTETAIETDKGGRNSEAYKINFGFDFLKVIRDLNLHLHQSLASGNLRESQFEIIPCNRREKIKGSEMWKKGNKRLMIHS